MKAPEKIYIEPNLDSMWGMAERSCESEIEYTRTDAFIEKAAEYIANNMRCDGYTLQSKAKFIRDFKNYMKGE